MRYTLSCMWAEDEAQTRDPQLGRLMLYQLSYFRIFVGADGFEPPKAKASRFTVCPIWPLWNTPGEISTISFCEIESLFRFFIWASCRIRTNDPEITNHVLWPTELKRHRSVLEVNIISFPKAIAKLSTIFHSTKYFLLQILFFSSFFYPFHP